MSNVIINGKLFLSGCLILNEKNEVLLLYKKLHKHYETPGGKVNLEECSNKEDPSIEDLARTAERETYEELGNNIKLSKLDYFCNIEFTIPDGRKAIAYKFLTKIISGKPILNEPEIFEKFNYLSIKELEKFPISPDLKLILAKLKELFE